MSNTEALRQRLADEADLCRNDGANDIAALLDEARAALSQPATDDRWNEGYKHGLWQGRNCAAAQPAPARVPPELLRVAIGTLAHDRMGGCPDEIEGWNARDPQCAACRAILAAEAANGITAPGAPDAQEPKP